MAYRLTRAAPVFDPAQGLLRCEHFQMAYVSNDIEQACDLFAARLGIREFRRLEGALPQGGYIRAEFAWVGTLMYELIFASGPGSEIFTDRLPAQKEFLLRHHHLGFLLHDEAQWEAVLEQAARNNWAVPAQNSNPLVNVCFVDVPALPHYLEYLLPTEMGLEFFETVPRS